MWYFESGGVTIPLNEYREYTVGRRKDVDIVLFSTFVSRNHGVIYVQQDSKVYIRDNSSSNGIFVNDKRIEPNKKHLLKFNDLVGIGAPSDISETKTEIFRLKSNNEKVLSEWEIYCNPQRADFQAVQGSANNEAKDDPVPAEAGVASEELNCEKPETNDDKCTNKDNCGNEDNRENKEILEDEFSSLNIEVKIKIEDDGFLNFSQGNAEFVVNDDDSFPRSQLFAEVGESSKLKNENGTDEGEHGFKDDVEEVESIFCNIKKESSFYDDIDQCYELSDESDVDEDSKKWFEKLSQSQSAQFDSLRSSAPASSIKTDEIEIHDEFNENDYLVYDMEECAETDKELAFEVKKEPDETPLDLGEPEEADKQQDDDNLVQKNNVKEIRVVLERIELDLPQKKTNKDVKLTDEFDVQKNTTSEKPWKSVHSERTADTATKSKFSGGEGSKSECLKKTYVKPPVIDAMVLPPRRGSRCEPQPTEKSESKRKRKCEKDPHAPDKPVKKTRKARARASHYSTSDFSKDDKKRIKEERKIKLKEIAEHQAADAKKADKSCKIQTKPKVKVSISRGLFLVGEEPPAKKKFVIPKKKVESTGTSGNSETVRSVAAPAKLAAGSENKKQVSAAASSKHHGDVPDQAQARPNENGTSNSVSEDDSLVPKIKNGTFLGHSIDSIIEKERRVLRQVDQVLPRDKTNIDRNPAPPMKRAVEKTKVLKSILLRAFPHPHIARAKKKRVTFNDTPTVDYFQIECGNNLRSLDSIKDAPIPNKLEEKKKLVEMNSCPVDENVLWTILDWVPEWLEQQSHSESTPWMVTKHPLIPMLDTFNSHGDYYNIVTPLCLLELWRSIHKEWSALKYPITMSAVDTIDQLDGYKMMLRCHFLAKKSGFECRPSWGDLVLLELNVDPDHAVHKFGYVVNYIKRNFVTGQTKHRDELSQHVHKPDFIVYLEVLFHMPTVITFTEKLTKIRITSKHLNSDMRIFKSISMLASSPLCRHILKPSIRDFQVPDQRLGGLVLDGHLDPSQLKSVWEAYHVCMRNEPGIYMIQGPPGTGKSMVIANIIMQLLYVGRNSQSRRSCILLCAPSNGAVDEITLKLLDIRQKFPKEKRFRMLRMGRAAAFHPKVSDISLQRLFERDARIRSEKVIRDNPVLSQDYEFRHSRINIIKQNLAEKKAKNENTFDIEKQLADAEKDFESFRNCLRIPYEERQEIKTKLISGADIITTTLSSCGMPEIEELCSRNLLRFSCCIVDEATQSYEQETLIPLMLGINRMVLVGDPAQLSPTVLCNEARKLGYGQSLFVRLQKSLQHLPNNPIQMLNVQYRMHEEISRFPNRYFYGNKLRTSELVVARPRGLLRPFSVFSLHHHYHSNESEYVNTAEANFVLNLITVLLSETKYSIGVITPYAKQKFYLIQRFSEMMNQVKSHRVDINTVDGFQGQERDVIILSCVRHSSNIFLSDHQRLCVSLTRARRSLFICAHSAFFRSDSIWFKLHEDARLRQCLYEVTMERMNNPTAISQLVRI